MRSRRFFAYLFVLVICLALFLSVTLSAAAQGGSATLAPTPISTPPVGEAAPDSAMQGQEELVPLDFADCSSTHTTLTVNVDGGNVEGDIVELVCSGVNIELVDGAITDGRFETTEYGTFLLRLADWEDLLVAMGNSKARSGGFLLQTPDWGGTFWALPEQAAKLEEAIDLVAGAEGQEQTATATPAPPRISIPRRTPILAPTPSPSRTLAAPPDTTASDASAVETWTEPISGMTFVRVPAGEFIMGSTEEQVNAAVDSCSAQYGVSCDIAIFDDQVPQHKVYLEDYWISQTEVTNTQFRAFIEAGGYEHSSLWTKAGWQWREEGGITEPDCWNDAYYNKSNHPIVCVSWYEAVAYAHWLAQESGLDIRLPTEAEWEKAARGTDGRTWPWGEEALDGSRANSCDANCDEVWKDEGVDDGYPYTAPVGSYSLGASPYGVLDMAGNSTEWTASEYYAYPYDARDGRERLAGDAARIARGGSFDFLDVFQTSYVRFPNEPDSLFINFGFRVGFSGEAPSEVNPELPTHAPTRISIPTRTPIPSPTPSPAPSTTLTPQSVGVVASAVLNLRDGPGAEFPVLGQFQRGDEVTVVGQWNECAWVQVQTDQGDGWVSAAAQYLTLDAVCADIPLGEVRPLTGLVGRYVSAAGPGILEVDNQFGDGLAILATEDGTPVAAAYVREGEKYTIGNIADGTYILFFSKGTGWNGKGFNNTTTLQRFEDILPYETTATTTPGWSVTLYGTEEGTAATLNVPPEEFPQLP